MDSKTFVAGLVDEMNTLFGQLEEREILVAEAEGQLEVVTLLKMALQSELEASSIAAHWLPTTPEIDAKTVFAEQCHEEMKHYNLIVQRLEDLGEDVSDLAAGSEPSTPLYQYLRSLRTTIERMAAGPFACEAVAEVRNNQFIEFCNAVGDTKTAQLYTKVIQPEEVRHHRRGRQILERYATTPELQQQAANAMRSSLAIADELRSLAEKTKGLFNIPVS